MKRLNVALFISEFEDPFANTLCEGAVKAVKEKGYNLYIFPGKFVDSRISPAFEDEYAYQYNCLFQFISEKNKNGCTTTNTFTGHKCGQYNGSNDTY